MSKVQVITTAQADTWHAVLKSIARYDVYHLPEYHAVAETAGEGTAGLFVFQGGAYTIALPLLLRPMPEIAGAPPSSAGCFDATSVYGYAGPIGSHELIPHDVVQSFQIALHAELLQRRVISVFSRLHPFFPHAALLAGLGECPAQRRTVSIDLTQSVQQQKAGYRQNHREGIAKLIRKGLTVVHDAEGQYLDDFRTIYWETMRRVGASSGYFFSPEYFTQLWQKLRDHVHLFVVLHERVPLCAALFFECQGIVQYHLGGTRDSSRKLAPMKLLVEAAREWSVACGARVLHLGGGATALPDDPLLHFKIGFSERLHDFAVWRWVLVPEVFERLCQAQADGNERKGLCESQIDFFPRYRCPTRPRVPDDAALLAEAQA
jgi:hypothetical protein